jgi:hypothetical protein
MAMSLNNAIMEAYFDLLVVERAFVVVKLC